MPLPFLPLTNLVPLLIKHWRRVLLGLCLAGGAYYVHGAEKAKRELAELLVKAAERDSIAQQYEDSSRVLGEQADSLRGEVAEAEEEWDEMVRRLRREARERQSAQVAAGPTTSSDSVLRPAVPVDSTAQATEDTLVLDVPGCPSISALITACNKRVAVRDSLIAVLDARHTVDSLTIQELRSVPPVVIDRGPSRLERVVITTATAALGAYAGQRVSGQKGLLLGTSLGVIIGFLR